MTLDIILAHYDEPWEVGKPFFDMLNCQKGVDFSEFRVLLIHDGTDKFPDKLFADCPYQVKQYKIKHKGISAVRNKGIDEADATWITFCDFDDTYSNIYSLHFVFDVLDTDKCDLLWSPFFVESITKDKQIVINVNKQFNLVWTHNKYYRLDFLRNIGLRFNEDLYYSEDSAFNAVLNIQIDKKRIAEIKSPLPLYIWTFREGSATTDPKNVLKNMVGHFHRNVYVTDEFYDKKDVDADAMVARTMTDAYTHLTRKNRPDGCEPLEKEVVAFWRKHKKDFAKVDSDMIQRVIKASVKEATESGYIDPNRPKFGDWIGGLEEKYKE